MLIKKQTHAGCALAVKILTTVPTLLWLFPIIRGLGFDGNLFNAIIAATLLNISGDLNGVTVVRLLRAAGFAVGDGERPRSAASLIPGLVLGTPMLMMANGFFGLHVSGPASAFVGMVVIVSIAAMVNRALDQVLTTEQD